MCPGYGGEEGFPSPIRRWAEEIDKLFFAPFFCSEEEVEMDEALSHSPEK